MITNKINAAESIRGLACLAVVLSHLSLTFFPQMHHFDLSVVPQYPFFDQLYHSPFAFFYSGTGAVFFFFVLSAIIVVMVWILYLGFASDVENAFRKAAFQVEIGRASCRERVSSPV